MPAHRNGPVSSNVRRHRDTLMGTERSQIHKSKCACGAGHFIVDDCSPDHGWPGSERQWYESSIECLKCCLMFEIERRGRNFVLISRERIREREKLSREAFVRCEALMQQTPVLEVLREFERLLSVQPSVAAVYRIIEKHKLTYHTTESTFRKHWKTPESWISGNIRADKLPKVLQILRRSPPAILEELESIRHLSDAASTKIERIGDPIYVLPRESAA